MLRAYWNGTITRGKVDDDLKESQEVLAEARARTALGAAGTGRDLAARIRTGGGARSVAGGNYRGGAGRIRRHAE